MLQGSTAEDGHFAVAAGELGSQQVTCQTAGRFFRVDDANFARRYRFFYDQLAPMLELYRVRIGDMLTIKSLHQERLRSVGETARVRHVCLPGLGGFAHRGASSTCDGHGFLRELYVSSRRSARGRGWGDLRLHRRAMKEDCRIRDHRGRAFLASRISRGGLGGSARPVEKRRRRLAQPSGQGSAARLAPSQPTIQHQLEQGDVLNAAVHRQGIRAEFRRTYQDIEGGPVHKPGFPSCCAITWQKARV